MIFIDIQRPVNLPLNFRRQVTARLRYLSKTSDPKIRAKYIGKNNSWSLLKPWLQENGGEKCWYCEAMSTRSPCDVDHFRPKLAVTIDGAELADHPGYHWLAYEWSNYRISCQRCNRPESEGGVLRGKANEFPIQDEAGRCSTEDDPLDCEVPKLLDPCVQADVHLLAHGLDGEVKPSAPEGTWEFERADYTIRRLGFNSWKSPKEKRDAWHTVDTLIRIAGDIPDVVDIVKSHLCPCKEYSSFFRSAIGSHREKPWIEALL